ncbi:MAG: DnaD domain protein [Bacilli bacterium]|nr:DnaD domain protein [Bacilli bacterium]
MVSSAIDFRYLLLENYKKLKISENELVTILMIDHLIGQGNPFVTADLLSLKMSLDIKEIDKILASLLKKKMLEYVTTGKKTATTLEPLKQKLYSEFQLYLTLEEEQKKTKKVSDELENIYGNFQKLLGRSLSPVEISRIREWVSYGFSDEQIINALKDALSKGRKTLNAVDKILLSYQVRDDVTSEGISTISKDWNKNLEETIRIAKTPWLDDDK